MSRCDKCEGVGCSCCLTAGAGITITGTGEEGDCYEIAADAAAGCEVRMPAPNGVDDTADLEAIYLAHGGGGATICFEAGTYRLNKRVPVAANFKHKAGGENTTAIVALGDHGLFLVQSVNFVEFEEMQLQPAAGRIAVEINDGGGTAPSLTTFRRVFFFGGLNAILADGAFYTLVDDCYAGGQTGDTYRGINGANIFHVDGGRIQNTAGGAFYAVNCEDGQDWLVDGGCSIESTNGVRFNHFRGGCHDNYFEDATNLGTAILDDAGATDTNTDGNSFSGFNNPHPIHSLGTRPSFGTDIGYYAAGVYGGQGGHEVTYDESASDITPLTGGVEQVLLSTGPTTLPAGHYVIEAQIPGTDYDVSGYFQGRLYVNAQLLQASFSPQAQQSGGGGQGMFLQRRFYFNGVGTATFELRCFFNGAGVAGLVFSGAAGAAGFCYMRVENL